MSGPGRPFDPAELRQPGLDPADADEIAALSPIARRLEDLARVDETAPGSDFDDRVMAAIAAEAPPRPVVTSWSVAGLLVAVRDAWRITWEGGRPAAVRAQGLALVLITALAIGSIGSVAVVGAARWLVGPDASPPSALPDPAPASDRPSQIPSAPASPIPSASPSVAPSPSPSASASPDPTRTPPPPTASPTETDEPTETEPTETDSTETADPDDTPKPSDTPRPTDTPDPDDTPEPDETPEPDDTPEPTEEDHSGPGGGGSESD